MLPLVGALIGAGVDLVTKALNGSGGSKSNTATPKPKKPEAAPKPPVSPAVPVWAWVVGGGALLLILLVALIGAFRK